MSKSKMEQTKVLEFFQGEYAMRNLKINVDSDEYDIHFEFIIDSIRTYFDNYNYHFKNQIKLIKDVAKDSKEKQMAIEKEVRLKKDFNKYKHKILTKTKLEVHLEAIRHVTNLLLEYISGGCTDYHDLPLDRLRNFYYRNLEYKEEHEHYTRICHTSNTTESLHYFLELSKKHNVFSTRLPGLEHKLYSIEQSHFDKIIADREPLFNLKENSNLNFYSPSEFYLSYTPTYCPPKTTSPVTTTPRISAITLEIDKKLNIDTAIAQIKGFLIEELAILKGESSVDLSPNEEKLYLANNKTLKLNKINLSSFRSRIIGLKLWDIKYENSCNNNEAYEKLYEKNELYGFREQECSPNSRNRPKNCDSCDNDTCQTITSKIIKNTEDSISKGYAVPMG